jgi:hypothetical protein
MGIELVSGRGLEPGDRRADVEEGVVVVNRALAAKYFPGVDPVGQRIGYGGRWDRIVGVADDVAEGYLSPEPFPARYMVHEQVPSLLSWQTVVVRARAGVDPVALLEPARRALQAAQPSVAVRESTTLRRVHTTAIGPVLQVRSLVALLAGLALALGVVGVYGVVSHFVTRRRRDWGIRMALGLRPAEVAALIVRRSGTLLGAGVALGLVGFLLLSRLLTSFLYGVEAADPASLAAAVAVLGAAGLAAAALPARRAARVDPAAVLREP